MYTDSKSNDFSKDQRVPKYSRSMKLSHHLQHHITTLHSCDMVTKNFLSLLDMLTAIDESDRFSRHITVLLVLYCHTTEKTSRSKAPDKMWTQLSATNMAGYKVT
jgi:hypothetical protein